jgi:hypothetical protein
MLIWSFKKIKELESQLGFVNCDDSLAEKLLNDGHVQNPMAGGNMLTPMDADSVEVEVYKVAAKKKKVADSEGDK